MALVPHKFISIDSSDEYKNNAYNKTQSAWTGTYTSQHQKDTNKPYLLELSACFTSGAKHHQTQQKGQYDRLQIMIKYNQNIKNLINKPYLKSITTV